MSVLVWKLFIRKFSSHCYKLNMKNIFRAYKPYSWDKVKTGVPLKEEGLQTLLKDCQRRWWRHRRWTAVPPSSCGNRKGAVTKYQLQSILGTTSAVVDAMDAIANGNHVGVESLVHTCVTQRSAVAQAAFRTACSLYNRRAGRHASVASP